ncbi:MAG: Rpn family recombination-promoting nuclease/putative transposase [Chlamydiales bacterium]|nr:Rpn family recombination-promoting nuclease/putative transposase [Chlamydiales bacterium]
MLTKFLDPKNDIAFKRIFGTEKNKDILIHFLNDMVKFKEQAPIVDVTFLKTIQDPEIAFQKVSIVDILCKDERGNAYIVEMQVASERGFEKRAQFYAAKVYVNQAKSGKSYENLKEVIFLAIVDYIMFPEKKEYKSDHVILDKNNYEHNLRDFSFTFLELPKFDKDIHSLDNIVDKWAYFFKHAEETTSTDLKLLADEDPIIERAYEELERHGWNANELLTYDHEEMSDLAFKGKIAAAEDKGKAEGKAEGKMEGFVEGNLQASKRIAENLYQNGLDLQTIVNVTGLSLEELKQQFRNNF